MDSRAAQAYALAEEFGEDLSESLDDMVHDAASRIGSVVNNGGISEQVLFLLEQGVTEQEIREALEATRNNQ